MKTLVALVAAFALATLMVPGQEARAAPKYTGVKMCKACHKKAYATWKDTKHAKAFAALKGEDAKKPECVGCHTTGYPGSGAVSKKQQNVQCEACHGAGGKYRKVMMKKKSYTREKAVAAGLVIPDEAVCKQCHNEKSPNFKGFDFKERLAAVKHSK